jgi:hypothetical protein
VKYRREFDTCCRGELGLTASSSKINKFKHKQHIYIIIIYIVYNSVYIHILIYIDISCTILYVFILSELIYIYIYYYTQYFLVTSFFGKLALVPVFSGTKTVAVNPNPCPGISMLFLYPRGIQKVLYFTKCD